jgi:hypothetical protein
VAEGWAVANAASGEIVAQNYATKKLATAICSTCESGAFWPSRNLQKVWVIGDQFVCEAGEGGLLIGELPKLDMTKFEVIERMTQAEFDKRMKRFHKKYGYFPDS